MPSAISIAHSSPLDSVIRTGQQTLRDRQTSSADIVCASGFDIHRGWRLHSYADPACGPCRHHVAYSVCSLSGGRCDFVSIMPGRLAPWIGYTCCAYARERLRSPRMENVRLVARLVWIAFSPSSQSAVCEASKL